MSETIGVLIKSQLSRAYLDGLLQRYDVGATIHSVSEMQSSGILKLWRTLRGIRPDLLLIPIEDENSRFFLPVIELLALATRAKRIVVVGGQYEETPFSKASALSAFGALIGATCASAVQTIIANFEIRRLMRHFVPAHSPASIKTVLYINANLWFGVKAGGSVGHISGVINALSDSGVRVDFASCGTRLMVRDAEYVPLNAPAAFGVPFEFNYYRFSRDVVKLLGRTREHRRYDAIYQRLSLANYSGAVLAQRMKIPLITEFNGSEAWVAKNWGKPLWLHGLATRAEDVMLRNSDVVVTVSDVLADELVSRGVSKRRIVSYPNCIDPLIFDPARYSAESRLALRRQLDISPEAVVATFVGTFGQWHGSDILATAIHELIRSHRGWLEDRNVVFVLVGDGVKMPVVRRILSEVDSAPFCRLIGLVPQAEAPSYLAMSDILLSPHVENADGTSFFGSPTKLFEYMAMSKAIVASRLDQIAHVMDGSLDAANLPRPYDPSSQAVGVLGKPGDVSQLVDGIRYCVENPDWRAKLGENARVRALQRYTWQNHVDAILNGLESVKDMS